MRLNLEKLHSLAQARDEQEVALNEAKRAYDEELSHQSKLLRDSAPQHDGLQRFLKDNEDITTRKLLLTGIAEIGAYFDKEGQACDQHSLGFENREHAIDVLAQLATAWQTVAKVSVKPSSNNSASAATASITLLQKQ